MPKPPENLREFSSLVKVVECLRGPDGCPWDKEQTHASLTRYAIEEACELAEAIDGGSDAEMRDELGDCLLQVVLHAEIARQRGAFDIQDVVQTLSEKMVRRHPHVFGDVQVGSSGEVLTNWAEIKAMEEKTKRAAGAGAGAAGAGAVSAGDTNHSKKTEATHPLSKGIPASFPALLSAQKIGERTTKHKFDWSNAMQCWNKVREEIGELQEQLEQLPPSGTLPAPAVVDTRAELSALRDRIEAELGDVLFSLAQLARHLGLDSEQALRKCNTRFEQRFVRMQTAVKASGHAWESLPSPEKEKFWKGAKG